VGVGTAAAAVPALACPVDVLDPAFEAALEASALLDALALDEDILLVVAAGWSIMFASFGVWWFVQYHLPFASAQA